MTRRIVSAVSEVVGVALIAWAIWTVSVPLAAAFVGVALIVVSWVSEGGKQK